MVSTRFVHKHFPKPFSRQPLASAAARRVDRTRIARNEIRAQRKLRARKLYQSILGNNPTFSGKVIISSDFDARKSDYRRLMNEDQNIDLGHTIVYWADGSYAYSGSNAGYMGAAIAWLDGDHYAVESFELGRYTGNSEDAEIYAIAAALGRAKKEVWESMDIHLVKVYSDAMGILEALANGTPLRVDPMLHNENTALHNIYDRAQWLANKGVELELIWVKGHAQSRGNALADRAAYDAVSDQPDRLQPIAWQWDWMPGKWATSENVSAPWKDMGSEWVEEWLSRANAQNTEDRMAKPTFMNDSSDEELPTTGVPEDVREPDAELPADDPAEDNQFNNDRPDGDKELKPSQYPVSQRLAFSRVPHSTPDCRAFSVPDLSQYGNITVEQAFEDLRAKLLSSSDQGDDDSDEEGTQYELDMQIENDILLAQRDANCKL
jgi:ribonuclease HI